MSDESLINNPIAAEEGSVSYGLGKMVGVPQHRCDHLGNELTSILQESDLDTFDDFAAAFERMEREHIQNAAEREFTLGLLMFMVGANIAVPFEDDDDL